MLAGYRLVSVLVRWIPDRAGRRLFRFIGSLFGYCDRTRRHYVTRHVLRVRGSGLSQKERRKAVGEVFASYAEYWFRSFRLPGMAPEDLESRFTIEGYHHVIEARESGPGPILALPHLGCWEWAGFWLSRIQGLEVAAVAEEINPPELFAWFVDLRAKFGLTIIPLDSQAGVSVLKAIAGGQVVCLLSDRLVGGTGIDVKFFGETTSIPAGPAVLALRSGAPIIPVGVYDTPNGCHAIVRPPIGVRRTGKFRDDVTQMTEDLVVELEILIRHDPSQWHLLQPNWPSDQKSLKG